MTEQRQDAKRIDVLADGEPDDGDGYEWCWIACPHDPPCASAPPSKDWSDA